MSKQSLIDRLLELPQAMVNAELALLESEQAKANFQSHLTLVEDQLLLNGSLDGKNAETRAAQLRQATVASREGVDAAAATVASRRIRRDQLVAEFSSLRAIARLMAAGAE